MFDQQKNPMNITIGQYLELKKQMEVEIQKSLSSITEKYKNLLWLTPSWIEIESVETTGIGDTEKQYMIGSVQVRFPIGSTS